MEINHTKYRSNIVYSVGEDGACSGDCYCRNLSFTGDDYADCKNGKEIAEVIAGIIAVEIDRIRALDVYDEHNEQNVKSLNSFMEELIQWMCCPACDDDRCHDVDLYSIVGDLVKSGRQQAIR